MALLNTLHNLNLSQFRVARPVGRGLERAARLLERQAEGLETSLLEPPQEVTEEVTRLLRNGSQDIPRKHMKLVVAGGIEQVFNEPDGKTLIERLLDLILSSTSSLLVKSLLLGYLRISQENAFLVSSLRKVLLKKKDGLPKRWIERIEKYDLLGEQAGITVANRILFNTENQPWEILEDAGFKRGLLLGGGYSEAVFKCMVFELSKGHQGIALSRFMSLANQKWPDGELLYPFTSSRTGDLALISSALLGPYLNDSPTEDIRIQIEDFLLERFEDPRVNIRRWSRVSQEHKAVLSRWLTQQSFEMLMQILKSSNNTGQWKDRSKFWGYYLENDHVTDAWVILGPEALTYAERLIADGTLKSRSSFGVLSRDSYSPIQPIHSVILMKIGGLTISEWTHDGKIRIYHPDNERKQHFYKSSYSPANLRNDEASNFFKSHLGNWQLDIENYILKTTGIHGPLRGGYKIRREEQNLNNQVRCQKCHQLKPERWLNAFGICGECAGGRIRSR